MDEEMLELIWTNHGPIFRYWLTEHREKEKYTDATIGCEGKLYAVHKLVLATCSNYFDEVFEHTEGKHPVLLLHDVKQHELEAILCYMYTGTANVSQLNLTRFMRVAKSLQIKGLAVSEGDSDDPLSSMETPRMETPRMDDGRTPASSSYCWQDRERRPLPNFAASPTTAISAPPMTSDVTFAATVTSAPPMTTNINLPRSFPEVKQEPREDSNKGKPKTKGGNEPQSQYSFQGFKYTHVEDDDKKDLIKKREVLEKIISQTEKQFSVDGNQPGPATVKDEFNNIQDVQIKQEVEESSDDQKVTVKKEKLPVANSRAKLLKNSMRRKLNGQKQRRLQKDKLRKLKRILGHTALKQHKCPQCSASFNRKFNLRSHMTVHEEVEDYVCTYCHAKFTSKELLTGHLTTHDQNKPYECALCHTAFSRKDKLTVHMRNHEDQGKATQAKNFNGKVFTCNECPATFENQSQFVEHSQMHASEKQFPCTVCPAAFAKKVHLSRHVLSHKGFGSRDKFQDSIE